MRPPRRPPHAVRISSVVSRSAGHSTILCVGNRLFHAHALEMTTLLSCSDGDVAEQGKGEARVLAHPRWRLSEPARQTDRFFSGKHLNDQFSPRRHTNRHAPQIGQTDRTDRPRRVLLRRAGARPRGCSPARVLARAPTCQMADDAARGSAGSAVVPSAAPPCLRQGVRQAPLANRRVDSSTQKIDSSAHGPY